MTPLCSCIECKTEFSSKGIFTHWLRAHDNSDRFKNSTGYNGHYSEQNYKELIKRKLNNIHDQKLGKLKKFEVSCHKCNDRFSVEEREFSFPSKEKYFCSRSCANSHNVSEDHRKKVSEKLSGRVYVSPTVVEKCCIQCGTTFQFTKRNTNHDKKFCSRSCSSRHSKKNIEKRKNRPALINYRADCSFKFNLADYPDEFDFKLIESYGWYKPKNRGNNLTGISRDHAVSVRYGFDNNIPPEHLAHPANCILMQHGKNVSKGTSNSMTYEQLLIKIKSWDEKYKSSN